MRLKSLALVMAGGCVLATLPQAAIAADRPSLQLSLDEAVKRALENNVDIAVERYNPELSLYSLKAAQASYDTSLQGFLRRTSETRQVENAFSGSSTKTVNFDLGASQYLLTGGTLNLNFRNYRYDTDQIGQGYNPLYSSGLSATLSQPLLRNFMTDSARNQIRISKRNKEISDLRFRQTVTNTIADVKSLYYNLLYTLDQVASQRKSLAWAKKLLEENQIKVKVGTLAPLNIVEAEAEVARVEANVIVAEASVATAEDNLKSAIFPKQDAAMWALQIVPIDRPTAEPIEIAPEKAIENALARRIDIQTARKNLESYEDNLRLRANQKLPSVDLQASYGSKGVGGDLLVYDQGILGPVTGTVPGGYGDAFSRMLDNKNITWYLGVNVSYSLRNRQAAALEAQARVTRDQAQASLRALELRIASEVRAAARNVETALKSVEATRAARVQQARRLDAEEKRFSAGMSTNFLVTQALRDLASSEAEELRALADYRMSLINYERAQETGSGSISYVSASSTRSAF